MMRFMSTPFSYYCIVNPQTVLIVESNTMDESKQILLDIYIYIYMYIFIYMYVYIYIYIYIYIYLYIM